MALSAKFVRKQLELFESLMKDSSIDTARVGQNQLGKIMALVQRKKVSAEECVCGSCTAFFVSPQERRREGVLLYLHGGGYCCGNKSYAKGVGSFLAEKFGTKVFAIAYRLAPETVFPGALEDSLAAYKYLLSSGYDARDIVVCGESAGGGLVFSLCIKLRELGLPLPSGLFAISPWTDMLATGDSYEFNKENDPTLSTERLNLFKSLYLPCVDDYKDPLVSPLMHDDFEGFPKTYILVGGHEILLSDAEKMHEKLIKSGVESEITVAPEMWHAHILYDLKERAEDYDRVNEFLDNCLRPARELSWLPLDNAAKIYPAAKRRNWSNVFRLSANLKDDISIPILKSALERTVRRFPSIAVRLCKGSFWYYLEELKEPPELTDEVASPLRQMKSRELRKCAFRVITYKNRIAVEIFHSITDGNGGLVFLKTLLAEYAEQRYGVKVPAECGILDRREAPKAEELEDSFLKYSGDVAMSRRDTDAFKLSGTREIGGFTHLVTFVTDPKKVYDVAKRYGVSVTAFLCASLMQAIMEIQDGEVPVRRLRKPVKVLLPVNLRKIFPSKTLRNFVLYITPFIDPQMGAYTFDEICKSVYHQMGMEITANRMAARITTNVNSEKAFVIKIMPLFIKNLVMKMIYNAVGERKTSMTLSNLGDTKLPAELSQFVERLDFVLSVPATTPYNCSVISCGDVMTVSFVRNIKEAEVERRFHRIMKEFGIEMTVESNGSTREEKRGE